MWSTSTKSDWSVEFASLTISQNLRKPNIAIDFAQNRLQADDKRRRANAHRLAFACLQYSVPLEHRNRPIWPMFAIESLSKVLRVTSKLDATRKWLSGCVDPHSQPSGMDWSHLRHYTGRKSNVTSRGRMDGLVAWAVINGKTYNTIRVVVEIVVSKRAQSYILVHMYWYTKIILRHSLKGTIAGWLASGGPHEPNPWSWHCSFFSMETKRPVPDGARSGLQRSS